MKDNDWLWLAGFGAFIVIAALGGFKNANTTANSSRGPVNSNNTQTQAEIQSQIIDTQYQVDNLQRQVAVENEKKNASQYKGIVDLQYINRSDRASEEYVVLRVVGTTKQPIDITGWTLTSTSSGSTIKIPKATYLFFTGTQNTEDDVYVEANDTIYIATGYSPNGASFKTNKCSGYLEQFQDFNPNLNLNCPRPRDENTSSIPRSPNNDACLDYIEYFPQCRIQTETLPANWSYECTNFIYSKINYPSCINTHKNDSDFYQNEWRIYLKRSSTLWKNSRETVILYDNTGKIVDTLKY